MCLYYFNLCVVGNFRFIIVVGFCFEGKCNYVVGYIDCIIIIVFIRINSEVVGIF